MKKNIFFIVIILSNFILLNAQNLKSVDFKICHFYQKENSNISIISCSSIDKNGNLKVYLEGFKDTPYYVYQLNESETNNINQLFDNKLSDYIEKEKVPKSTNISERFYISYKNQKNNTEKLCFMDRYMSKKFNRIMNSIFGIIYKNVIKNDETKNNFKISDYKKMKKEIITEIKKDKNLPILTFDAPSPPTSK